MKWHQKFIFAQINGYPWMKTSSVQSSSRLGLFLNGLICRVMLSDGCEKKRQKCQFNKGQIRSFDLLVGSSKSPIFNHICSVKKPGAQILHMSQ